MFVKSCLLELLIPRSQLHMYLGQETGFIYNTRTEDGRFCKQDVCLYLTCLVTVPTTEVITPTAQHHSPDHIAKLTWRTVCCCYVAVNRAQSFILSHADADTAVTSAAKQQRDCQTHVEQERPESCSGLKLIQLCCSPIISCFPIDTVHKQLPNPDRQGPSHHILETYDNVSTLYNSPGDLPGLPRASQATPVPVSEPTSAGMSSWIPSCIPSSVITMRGVAEVVTIIATGIVSAASRWHRV